MAVPNVNAPTQADYDLAAQLYLRRLPPEHFMEATTQATQRAITVDSFEALRVRRPDIQIFSELLVQFPRRREGWPRGVVPDNMVVVHPEPIVADTSFALTLQPVGPLIVMEYVSQNSSRKDYVDSARKYERRVKAPYYLTFHPEQLDLRLRRLGKGKYRPVPINDAGRHPIPEIDLEVGVLDGWVRFWYAGELLPVTAELVDTVAAKLAEIAEKEAEIAAKDVALATKDVALATKDVALATKDVALATKDAVLATKDAVLATKDDEIAALKAELARLKGS